MWIIDTFWCIVTVLSSGLVWTLHQASNETWTLFWKSCTGEAFEASAWATELRINKEERRLRIQNGCLPSDQTWVCCFRVSTGFLAVGQMDRSPSVCSQTAFRLWGVPSSSTAQKQAPKCHEKLPLNDGSDAKRNQRQARERNLASTLEVH